MSEQPFQTLRSLVGMTMGARRRRLWDEFFDEAWDGATIRNFRTEAAKYRLGQRLRPCPGCAECAYITWIGGRPVRNAEHICDGSGVLLAKKAKARR